jgi:hypothetical protein
LLQHSFSLSLSFEKTSGKKSSQIKNNDFFTVLLVIYFFILLFTEYLSAFAVAQRRAPPDVGQRKESRAYLGKRSDNLATLHPLSYTPQPTLLGLIPKNLIYFNHQCLQDGI